MVLIAAAIGLIAVSSIILPGLGSVLDQGPHGPGPFGAPPAQGIAPFENNVALIATVSALNVVLAIYLLFTYVRNYLNIRANFTLGIVAFLFSFLLYALLSFPLIHTALGPYGIASTLPFVPMLFSAIGLLIFARIGNE